jgi:hypothetical protein
VTRRGWERWAALSSLVAAALWVIGVVIVSLLLWTRRDDEPVAIRPAAPIT